MIEVEITREGLRHLNPLPGKVRDAAIPGDAGAHRRAPHRRVVYRPR
ncbi:MAG TPA: hypothetical protein VHM23_11665 [Actinomycetota bacterium]|nr:hypothetical protein [Actinomycetota bacterium]